MSKLDAVEGYEIVARYHVEDDAKAAAETLLLGDSAPWSRRQTDHEARLHAGRGRRVTPIVPERCSGSPPSRRAPSRCARRPKSNVFWIGAIFIAAMVILPRDRVLRELQAFGRLTVAVVIGGRRGAADRMSPWPASL